MTGEVIVKVRGLQMMEEDSDVIETIAPGKYYLKNGKHYILYEETQEGFDEVTKNRIKLMPDYMELQKSGLTNVHMIFEKGKKNVTCYYTPYGSLQLGVFATKVDITEGDDKIIVEVAYELELNDAPLAESHITLEVLASGSEVQLG